MGNEQSTPREVSAEDAQFTFGVELEMVLEPNYEVLSKLEGPLAEELKALPKNEDYAKLDEPTKKERRLAWAKFIALLLHTVLPDNIKVLYAGSEEATKAKANGTYYQSWTVIADDLTPVGNQCMWYL